MGYYNGTTTTTTNARTINTPTYGITGYESGTTHYTTFTRYFKLGGVDLGYYLKTNKYVTLWDMTVTSTGSSSDLRRIFPVLVGASQQYIGTSTGQKVKIQLYEDDKRILEVKGIKINGKSQ